MFRSIQALVMAFAFLAASGAARVARWVACGISVIFLACGQAERPAVEIPERAAVTPDSAAADERPNIVIVLFDDTGFADLGAYGSEVDTPNIDSLAAAGVRFANFHTAAACTPTRGMLLTGVDNHRVGMGNMLEIMADNQFDQPGYEGTLSHDAVTVMELLRDAGYHTYMAGKWHLGKTKDSLPAARGFERSIALMESGADNWEEKSYLPMYEHVNFYENFEKTTLPEDFFSSRYYVDRLIEYIDDDRDERRPFFAYLSLQAQHYPLQAPEEYIQKYADEYDGGWAELRAARYARQVELGLVPGGLSLQPMPIVPDWDALTDDERRHAAKKMAVYAAMLDNADANVGRLMDHLRGIGEHENTIYVVMGDNGADNNEQDKVFPEWYAANFDLSYERMGLRGSYVNYGPGWAAASGAPLTLFKGSASEGGMRVPFIISYPKGIREGVTAHAFGYVTDVTPTLLDLAGVPAAPGEYAGREVHPINGRTMLPLLRGESETVHPPGVDVAYELAGSAAVFRGDLKLMKNNPPFGDRQWRLYDVRKDPVEANDLSAAEPELRAEMLAAYDRYVVDFGLIEVPDDYNPIEQIQKNVARNQAKEALDRVPVLD